MKVKLSDIPVEGLTLTEKLDPVGKDLQTPDLKFTAPVSVTAFFQKERDTVVVQAEAAGNLELTCGRCLTTYQQPYQGHFDLGYTVKEMFVLDVTDDLRQEILLTYPMKLLCKEDCRGLCPKCGANLNEGACRCPR